MAFGGIFTANAGNAGPLNLVAKHTANDDETGKRTLGQCAPGQAFTVSLAEGEELIVRDGREHDHAGKTKHEPAAEQGEKATTTA